MPHKLDSGQVSPEIQRILDIYAQINVSSHFDSDDPRKQKELLGEFVGRETFVGIGPDGQIQAVATYTTDMSPDYAWIEGLAVHPDHQGTKKHIGSTMVRNLVGIARLDERNAIELSAIPTAVPFWTKQGFKTTAVNPKSSNAMMRLEI